MWLVKNTLNFTKLNSSVEVELGMHVKGPGMSPLVVVSHS